ncbi:molybdate transport system permease protein [Methanomicrobium sp. W14]|uniref:ABC transporter permease n=1 Tax=Methanomicrobium sp. W14 TaxID=2817839 RepID=UPI001AE8DBB8|nr:ABC transporter permease [Methanomicrobium sp. W14]MBP2134547.1 molybdate transport system permease protein [Methanomicrobium sp. W14]
MSDIRHSWLKRVSIGTGIFLTAFILIVLILIVTYPTPENLFTSIISEEIRFAIGLSLITSVTSTIFCIILAVPTAYALARYNFRGRNIINTAIDMPLALPPLVAGVGLLLLFGTTSFGKELTALGIKFIFTPYGIIIAQFFVNLPFMVRILRSAFSSISPRYEYVARTLGCSEFSAFCRVTLPMAKDGFIAGTVITWSRAIGEFGAALMVAGATRMKTESLPVAVYLNMSTGDLDMATSAAAILILIAVISLYVFEKFGGTTQI